MAGIKRLGLTGHPSGISSALDRIANVVIINVLVNQVSSEEKEIELTLQGEEAERHIAKLLKPLVGRGGQLFSRLDENKLRIKDDAGLDILLNLSGIRFAISVKSKRYEKVKVFYDPKYDQIRYSCKEYRKDWFPKDITKEINDQINWLLTNRPKLFSKKKQPKKPWLIVVVCGVPSKPVKQPPRVAVFPNSPKEVINGTEYLKHRGVFVVDEESLISLVQVLKTQPNEEYVPSQK